MKEIIQHILRKQMKIDSPVQKLVKLHGDASARTYFRCLLEDGRSFVVMQLPDGPASISEEITHAPSKPIELPFLNIARFLSHAHLLVPKIHYYI